MHRMGQDDRRRLLYGTVAAALVVGAFSLWIAVAQDSLHLACAEDAWIENTSALLFCLSGLGFVVFAARSRFLRQRKSRWVYFFPVCWALLMIFFAGEEISWGQRIFGYETPAWLEDNLQDEFNVHNLGPLDTILGGKYRYLSIMMLMTGLLIPLFARLRVGGRLIRFFAFPVSPLAYWLFFVGAYVYGKVWDPVLQNDAAEVRELIMALGLALFAWHGACRPPDLYLLDSTVQDG